jgi:hypothetical protein
MDHIDVFNMTMDELVQDAPESRATKTIRKLLVEQRNNSYFKSMGQGLRQRGLRFYVLPSDTDYLPYLEYMRNNVFGMEPKQVELRDGPVSHDYCFQVIAKELVDILNNLESDI